MNVAALIASMMQAFTASAPAEAVTGLDPWARLLIAAGLLLLAFGLLLIEFFIVSWGLLSIAAAGCAYAACAIAFAVSSSAGWAFLAACPLATAIIIPWGFRRIQRSRMVPKAEITADAGYRHHTEELGIAPGAVGELVTDALPTGRARFAGGDVDVAVEGNGLSRGAHVVVLRIEGPVVTVRAAS